MTAYLDAMRRYAAGGSGGPAPADKQALYLQESGDGGKLNENDIAQGSYGDCFLLAALGEVARVAPQDIVGDIRAVNATHEVVTFHGGQQGWDFAAPFESTEYRTSVDNDFPDHAVNWDNARDTQGGKTEIWPQVMEAAYAQTHGGYDAFASGGSATQALEAITGHGFTYTPMGEVTAQGLRDMAGLQDAALVFDTKSGSLGDGLVGWHDYIFDGLSKDHGRLMVHLTNPWGMDQPGPIPFRDLAANFAGIDHGQA